RPRVRWCDEAGFCEPSCRISQQLHEAAADRPRDRSAQRPSSHRPDPMKLLKFLQTAASPLSPRARRVWVGAARAQIEYRDVTLEELEDFRVQLEHAARDLPLLRWVEVNPHAQRVVFAFEPDAYGSEELVAVVEAAERACDLHLAPFREAQPDHPADLEPAERPLLELGADAVGF